MAVRKVIRSCGSLSLAMCWKFFKIPCCIRAVFSWYIGLQHQKTTRPCLSENGISLLFIHIIRNIMKQKNHLLAMALLLWAACSFGQLPTGKKAAPYISSAGVKMKLSELINVEAIALKKAD